MMSGTVGASDAATFLRNFEEKAEFNQYWYSQRTIDRIVQEVVRIGGRVGFLSTPSIYFALPEDVRAGCFVFDVRLGSKSPFNQSAMFTTYNEFRSMMSGRMTEDLCILISINRMIFQASFWALSIWFVVDPPFITEEVWRKYGASSNLLRKTGVDENGRLLHYYFSCVLRLQSVA